jgi:glycogen synthase
MKVLMLGWEFPPLFSGGLGVATHGIVKSLSRLSQIRLIVPTAGDVSDLKGVHITGLNKISASEVNLERLGHTLQFENTEVFEVPMRLSPYHHINQSLEANLPFELNYTTSIEKTETLKSIFSDGELYGRYILFKVNLFAHLAEELAADGQFDIIHSHDWVTYPAAWRIKKRTGKPLVVHVHALETDRAGESARNEIYWMEKTGMEQADRIIAVSEYTKAQIQAHYQIDASKIDVVHNGIEPAETARTTHQLKDKLVVFLGRITRQKGPQFLLETAVKVHRVYPRVKFVVAGSGDEFAHLLESTAYKKVGRQFIFAGFLSKVKVNELLSMADVYFMPSVSEPFGLTALEAAQHKVPSVISAQSGAAEVLKASLQADFWDTDKHANYIHALLKYAALGKELTEQSWHELEGLTWDSSARKIMEVYGKVL